MTLETVFAMSTANIKYGPGATRELGYEMKQLGARRVMVVTDPRLGASAPVCTALESLRSAGLDAALFDRVRVEPTDVSLKEAIRFAAEGRFDGFCAVGGGSSIDTAKAAALYTTYPDDFLAYVAAPFGKARPVPGRLKPLIAVPTTAGTGSETTAVCVFDYSERHAKTVILHQYLRPAMGIIDPDNTRTLPRMVAACTGWDVLCHAIESLTALPYHQRLAPEHPGLRPAHQGANPISDIWTARAIEMVSQNLARAIDDPTDDEARGAVLLAATIAGVGFGNAGVHLPHAMAYGVVGLVRDYVPEGYPPDHPLIPHGMSVVLTAPAVFRYTAPANPQRHLHAARLMGVDVTGARPEAAGELLSGALVDLMRRTGIPNGLSAVGYGPDDVEGLVAGTLPQQRTLRLSPRPVTEADLRQLFMDSLKLW